MSCHMRCFERPPLWYQIREERQCPRVCACVCVEFENTVHYVGVGAVLCVAAWEVTYHKRWPHSDTRSSQLSRWQTSTYFNQIFNHAGNNRFFHELAGVVYRLFLRFSCALHTFYLLSAVFIMCMCVWKRETSVCALGLVCDALSSD